MATVHVFDPALCCPTGVCGPTVDPKFAAFSADLDWLKTQGAAVERFNLAQQPGAFASNEVVRQALQERGNESLPLILVDGRIASEGAYPSRDALAAMAGVVIRKMVQAPATAGGCTPSKAGGKSGCC